ncbi:MAG TPA: hypothetical protein VF519_09955 [Mycobacteriales bacterium]|jgi:hypothetical protein
MAAEPLPYPTPHQRLLRHFATRARVGDRPEDRAAWLAQAWLRATFVLPGASDDDLLGYLDTEWAAFRRTHPGEPHVAFAPPAAPAEEPVVPGPPPYDELAPLRFGRYGSDHLPTHEERVRDEQERLARRDQAYYGF